MRSLPGFLLCTLLLSCNRQSNKKNTTILQDTVAEQVSSADSFPKTSVLTPAEAEAAHLQFEEDARMDSIRLLKATKQALAYAIKNIGKAAFNYNFSTTPNDSSYSINNELSYGNLFSTHKKHLLLRQTVPGATTISIFTGACKFRQVCKHLQDGMSYLDDSLKDVNGDGHKALAIHSYSGAGCCLRDVYNIYLYLPQTGHFSAGYEFMNPVFFPKEKIIRGMGYGHPGETELYKYKWNGLKVDTIEFIYRDTTDAPRFYISKQSDWHRPPIVKKKLLLQLPKEYAQLEFIDWFLNK